MVLSGGWGTHTRPLLHSGNIRDAGVLQVIITCMHVMHTLHIYAHCKPHTPYTTQKFIHAAHMCTPLHAPQPGVGMGDTLRLTFTKDTNEPPVASYSDVQRLLNVFVYVGTQNVIDGLLEFLLRIYSLLVYLLSCLVTLSFFCAQPHDP